MAERITMIKIILPDKIPTMSGLGHSICQLPRVQKVEPGSLIFIQEDVFTRKEGRYKHAGIRKAVLRVVGPSELPRYIKVQVVKSEGVNADPAGANLLKPYKNLLYGFDVSAMSEKASLATGGHLEGFDKSGKKVVTGDADKGGISIGAKHGPEGGIKGVVGAEKRNIEVQDNEIHLPPAVSADTRTYNFDGQQLTAKEIASKLNVLNGGVQFEQGGKLGTPENPLRYSGDNIILKAEVADDSTLHEFDGKQMTPREIASTISVNNGGLAFAKGGTTSCRCSGKQYNFGGTMMHDRDIMTRLNNINPAELKKGYQEEKREHYNTLAKLNNGELTIDQALIEIAGKHLQENPNYYKN